MIRRVRHICRRNNPCTCSITNAMHKSIRATHKKKFRNYDRCTNLMQCVQDYVLIQNYVVNVTITHHKQGITRSSGINTKNNLLTYTLLIVTKLYEVFSRLFLLSTIWNYTLHQKHSSTMTSLQWHRELRKKRHKMELKLQQM